MSSGKMGKALLNAGTNALLCTVPANTEAVINIRFANGSGADAVISLAIAETATPADSDWVVRHLALPPGAIHETTGIYCSANEKIIALSNTTGVSVRAHGIASS